MDTEAVVERLENHGIPLNEAQSIAKVLQKVLNDSFFEVSNSFVLEDEMSKLMSKDLHLAITTSMCKSSLDDKSVESEKEMEKYQKIMDKIRKAYKSKLSKAAKAQKSKLNSAIEQIRDKVDNQQTKLTESFAVLKNNIVELENHLNLLLFGLGYSLMVIFPCTLLLLFDWLRFP